MKYCVVIYSKSAATAVHGPFASEAEAGAHLGRLEAFLISDPDTATMRTSIRQLIDPTTYFLKGN